MDFTPALKNQSFTNYTYWIKFTAPINASYYVISKNIFIDKMVLYSPSTKGWVSQEVGLLAPSDNDFSTLYIKIPNGGLGKTCYLLVQSNCISKLDLWLLTEGLHVKEETFKTQFYGIVITLISVYLLIVLFLFFASKRKGMLIMALYAMASILMILFTNGFLYEWLPNFGALFYKWSFVYVVDIYWGSAALLSFYLFEENQHSQRLIKAFRVAFGLLIVLMLTPFVLDRQLVSQIHFAVPMLFIMFNTFVGFRLFLQENLLPALYLSVGWLIYFGLLIIWSISIMSDLPNTFFIENAPIFGLMIEFILFASLGAKHYLSNQKENELLRHKVYSINEQKEQIEESYLAIYNSLTPR